MISQHWLRFDSNFQMFWGDYLHSSIDAFRMVKDPTDDMSTLVQVKVWCNQATSHSLNQCQHTWHHIVSLGHKELMISHDISKADQLTIILKITDNFVQLTQCSNLWWKSCQSCSDLSTNSNINDNKILKKFPVLLKTSVIVWMKTVTYWRPRLRPQCLYIP